MSNSKLDLTGLVALEALVVPPLAGPAHRSHATPADPHARGVRGAGSTAAAPGKMRAKLQPEQQQLPSPDAVLEPGTPPTSSYGPALAFFLQVPPPAPNTLTAAVLPRAHQSAPQPRYPTLQPPQALVAAPAAPAAPPLAPDATTERGLGKCLLLLTFNSPHATLAALQRLRAAAAASQGRAALCALQPVPLVARVLATSPDPACQHQAAQVLAALLSPPHCHPLSADVAAAQVVPTAVRLMGGAGLVAGGGGGARLGAAGAAGGQLLCTAAHLAWSPQGHEMQQQHAARQQQAHLQAAALAHGGPSPACRLACAQLLLLLAGPAAPPSDSGASTHASAASASASWRDLCVRCGALDACCAALSAHEHPPLQLAAVQLLAALVRDSAGWPWDWPVVRAAALAGLAAQVVGLLALADPDDWEGCELELDLELRAEGAEGAEARGTDQGAGADALQLWADRQDAGAAPCSLHAAARCVVLRMAAGPLLVREALVRAGALGVVAEAVMGAALPPPGASGSGYLSAAAAATCPGPHLTAMLDVLLGLSALPGVRAALAAPALSPLLGQLLRLFELLPCGLPGEAHAAGGAFTRQDAAAAHAHGVLTQLLLNLALDATAHTALVAQPTAELLVRCAAQGRHAAPGSRAATASGFAPAPTPAGAGAAPAAPALGGAQPSSAAARRAPLEPAARAVAALRVIAALCADPHFIASRPATQAVLAGAGAVEYGVGVVCDAAGALGHGACTALYDAGVGALCALMAGSRATQRRVAEAEGLLGALAAAIADPAVLRCGHRVRATLAAWRLVTAPLVSSTPLVLGGGGGAGEAAAALHGAVPRLLGSASGAAANGLPRVSALVPPAEAAAEPGAGAGEAAAVPDPRAPGPSLVAREDSTAAAAGGPGARAAHPAGPERPSHPASPPSPAAARSGKAAAAHPAPSPSPRSFSAHSNRVAPLPPPAADAGEAPASWEGAAPAAPRGGSDGSPALPGTPTSDGSAVDGSPQAAAAAAGGTVAKRPGSGSRRGDVSPAAHSGGGQSRKGSPRPSPTPSAASLGSAAGGPGQEAWSGGSQRPRSSATIRPPLPKPSGSLGATTAAAGPSRPTSGAQQPRTSHTTTSTSTATAAIRPASARSSANSAASHKADGTAAATSGPSRTSAGSRGAAPAGDASRHSGAPAGGSEDGGAAALRTAAAAGAAVQPAAARDALSAAAASAACPSAPSSLLVGVVGRLQALLPHPATCAPAALVLVQLARLPEVAACPAMASGWGALMDAIQSSIVGPEALGAAGGGAGPGAKSARRRSTGPDAAPGGRGGRGDESSEEEEWWFNVGTDKAKAHGRPSATPPGSARPGSRSAPRGSATGSDAPPPPLEPHDQLALLEAMEVVAGSSSTGRQALTHGSATVTALVQLACGEGHLADSLGDAAGGGGPGGVARLGYHCHYQRQSGAGQAAQDGRSQLARARGLAASVLSALLPLPAVAAQLQKDGSAALLAECALATAATSPDEELRAACVRLLLAAVAHSGRAHDAMARPAAVLAAVETLAAIWDTHGAAIAPAATVTGMLPRPASALAPARLTGGRLPSRPLPPAVALAQAPSRSHSPAGPHLPTASGFAPNASFSAGSLPPHLGPHLPAHLGPMHRSLTGPVAHGLARPSLDLQRGSQQPGSPRGAGPGPGAAPPSPLLRSGVHSHTPSGLGPGAAGGGPGSAAGGGGGGSDAVPHGVATRIGLAASTFSDAARWVDPKVQAARLLELSGPVGPELQPGSPATPHAGQQQAQQAQQDANGAATADSAARPASDASAGTGAAGRLARAAAAGGGSRDSSGRLADVLPALPAPLQEEHDLLLQLGAMGARGAGVGVLLGAQGKGAAAPGSEAAPGPWHASAVAAARAAPAGGAEMAAVAPLGGGPQPGEDEEDEEEGHPLGGSTPGGGAARQPIVPRRGSRTLAPPTTAVAGGLGNPAAVGGGALGGAGAGGSVPASAEAAAQCVVGLLGVLTELAVDTDAARAMSTLPCFELFVDLLSCRTPSLVLAVLGLLLRLAARPNTHETFWDCDAVAALVAHVQQRSGAVAAAAEGHPYVRLGQGVSFSAGHAALAGAGAGAAALAEMVSALRLKSLQVLERLAADPDLHGRLAATELPAAVMAVVRRAAEPEQQRGAGGAGGAGAGGGAAGGGEAAPGGEPLSLVACALTTLGSLLDSADVRRQARERRCPLHIGILAGGGGMLAAGRPGGAASGAGAGGRSGSSTGGGGGGSGAAPDPMVAALARQCGEKLREVVPAGVGRPSLHASRSAPLG